MLWVTSWGIFACSFEVDELKRTHDALDRALQMQSLYLENSPLAVIEWDEGGTRTTMVGPSRAHFRVECKGSWRALARYRPGPS